MGVADGNQVNIPEPMRSQTEWRGYEAKTGVGLPVEPM